MLIDSYIDYIRSVRRYSERTLQIYSETLRQFSDFSTESSSDEELCTALNPSSIRNYEVWLLDDRHDDARTVNLAMSVISGFCKYLVREGRLQSNPVRTITRPKTSKRLPVFYKAESMNDYFESKKHLACPEAVEFLKAFGAGASKDKTAVGWYRAILRRLIVEILYCTGIRRAELISLTVGSADLHRKVLKVRGKGDKMREIPIIDSLCKDILLYLQSVETMVGLEATPERSLLVTEKGAKLYPVYIDRAIKEELGEVRSITGRKSPHILRHTLATELLNDGTDLNSIKELLGHSSLAATQVYTHNSIEKLKNVYNNAHPRAKSGGNHGNQH